MIARLAAHVSTTPHPMDTVTAALWAGVLNLACLTLALSTWLLIAEPSTYVWATP